jgi:putative hydrolase of the HAD superfamily
VAVKAVIFDWGGTLTPWHTIDPEALWHDVCRHHFPAERAAAAVQAICAAERDLWELTRSSSRSATLQQVFERAGVMASQELLTGYFAAWEPHTFTDPDAPGVLRELRSRGIKVGVLSNTLWPRAAHEQIFVRDEVAELLDGAVYSSEIPWAKPHREAFLAAMTAVGVDDPAACVFVGDRPYDDVYGAKRAGMRGVLVPNSEVPPFDGVIPDAVITRLPELLGHLDAW